MPTEHFNWASWQRGGTVMLQYLLIFILSKSAQTKWCMHDLRHSQVDVQMMWRGYVIVVLDIVFPEKMKLTSWLIVNTDSQQRHTITLKISIVKDLTLTAPKEWLSRTVRDSSCSSIVWRNCLKQRWQLQHTTDYTVHPYHQISIVPHVVESVSSLDQLVENCWVPE